MLWLLAGVVGEVLRWLVLLRCSECQVSYSIGFLLLQGVPGSCCHGCAGNAGSWTWAGVMVW